MLVYPLPRSRRVAPLLLWVSLLSCKQAPPAVVTRASRADASLANRAVGQSFASALTGHRDRVYFADLDEIKKRKVLRVILRNNSTTYFLFRGDEVGFEYELALAFARELGLRLDVVLAPSRRDMIPMLLAGRGDLIAAGSPASAARAQRVVFGRAYMSVRNQVVVRKGRQPPLRAAKDLLHEMVYVRRNSGYFKRLRELGAQLGQTIPISAVPESSEVEDLIDQVAQGEIGVTIARSDFVDAERTWRDDIEVAFDLGEAEPIAWALRPDDARLKHAVDGFFARHHRDLLFNTLYAKYFKNPKRAAALRDDEVRADRGGHISPYDALLQKAAQTYQLDWRLLAAQAYQESRFDPGAQSWAGARGVMQLMPSTAAELGVPDMSDPAQSIDGGARYLRRMIDGFSEALPLKERIRFALAAYNVGRGHVDDARALARRLKLDPNRWFGHSAKAMRLLSRPRFYQKAEHGYCRGDEPVGYVSQIQTRYDAYVAVTENP